MFLCLYVFLAVAYCHTCFGVDARTRILTKNLVHQCINNSDYKGAVLDESQTICPHTENVLNCSELVFYGGDVRIVNNTIHELFCPYDWDYLDVTLGITLGDDSHSQCTKWDDGYESTILFNFGLIKDDSREIYDIHYEEIIISQSLTNFSKRYGAIRNVRDHFPFFNFSQTEFRGEWKDVISLTYVKIDLIEEDVSACSGNGYCIKNDLCYCDHGYEGKECEEITVFNCYGDLSNYSKNHVCSGNGRCIDNNNCSCYDGFYGNTCQNYNYFYSIRLLLIFMTSGGGCCMCFICCIVCCLFGFGGLGGGAGGDGQEFSNNVIEPKFLGSILKLDNQEITRAERDSLPSELKNKVVVEDIWG